MNVALPLSDLESRSVHLESFHNFIYFYLFVCEKDLKDYKS